MKKPDHILPLPTFLWRVLVIPIGLIVGVSGSIAQQAILSSGGNATGGGSVSYSVGQVAYNAYSDINSYSEAQGVQQPYEISVDVAVGIQETNGITLGYTAYPNPVIDMLTLTVNDNVENMSYELYDINGKLLQKSTLTANATDIPMHGLAPATYMLTVLLNDTKTKTFRIIKNQ